MEHGREKFKKDYQDFGLQTIWNHPRDSGILPCRVYLRHCLLACKNLSEQVYTNFIENTYLADRKTTLRKYLETESEKVFAAKPPEGLESRYSG